MKSYYISESELLELLTAYHRLAALENGGVDNWEWYDYAVMDYLEAHGKEEFGDIAQDELSDYIEVE